MILKPLFSVGQQDVIKAGIVTALVSFFGALKTLIADKHFPTWEELKVILLWSLIAGCSYIVKNYFTPLPKVVEIDPAKTVIVDVETKEILVNEIIEENVER